MYGRILILPDGDDHLTLNASFLASMDLIVVGWRIVQDKYGEPRTITASDLARHLADRRA